MNFLELFQMIGSNVWLYGGAFLLVLSVLVFIHEWGHYIVARMNGVHVDEFSIGFGPELFGWNAKNGTRWKFSLIPLGGYVKMYGHTDPASTKAEDVEAIPAGRIGETFFAKSVGARAAIVVAGPAINYIFAIIVMALVFSFQGQPLTTPEAAGIVGGSAAADAGFEPGDRVVAIDGQKVKSFTDIRRAMLITLDDERVFTVDRDGELIDLSALPKKLEQEDRFGFKSSRGFLGLVSPQQAIQLDRIVSIDGKEIETEDTRAALSSRFGKKFEIGVQGGKDKIETYRIEPLAAMNPDFGTVEYLVLASSDPQVFVKHSPVAAAGKAVVETWDITTGTLKAIGQMFTGQRSAQELGGLIRIGAMAGDVAKSGAVALLMFSALLSINLGLINLFPIPVLDGGHLVFYALEAVRGKPVSEKAQDYAFRVGFVLLIGLMLFANVNDLVQMFT